MKSSIVLKLFAILAVVGLSTPSFAQDDTAAPTTHASKKHKKRGHKKAKGGKHHKKSKAAEPAAPEAGAENPAN